VITAGASRSKIRRFPTNNVVWNFQGGHIQWHECQWRFDAESTTSYISIILNRLQIEATTTATTATATATSATASETTATVKSVVTATEKQKVDPAIHTAICKRIICKYATVLKSFDF
jgi:hypothetical protein